MGRNPPDEHEASNKVKEFHLVPFREQQSPCQHNGLSQLAKLS
jgi:hypothetical protein